MNENEQKFFTFGCRTCGGLQIVGRMTGGPDAFPVFPSKELALMEMEDFQSNIKDAESHPIILIEIGVRIIQKFV